MDSLAALLEPNAPTPADLQPIGFRGPFITIERHQGSVWVMIGGEFFARVIEPKTVPQFWQAYCRGLGVAREVGRQGI